MPNPSSRILIVAGIVLAAVTAAGGYSLGATSRPPVDIACVTTHHVLSHIYAHDVTCPKGQHKVQWNQQGPAGPPGPAGASGFLGIIAPEAVGPVGNVNGALIDSVTNTCPAGHATGGGYSWEEGATYPIVTDGPVLASNGTGYNAWTVVVQLPAPGLPDPQGSLGVYVICAK